MKHKCKGGVKRQISIVREEERGGERDWRIVQDAGEAHSEQKVGWKEGEGRGGRLVRERKLATRWHLSKQCG